jgi:hypothetical protein
VVLFQWTHELFGAGIFASNGDAWLKQRKAASNIFTKRLLRDAMTPVFVEHAGFAAAKLKAVAARNDDIDMQVQCSPVMRLKHYSAVSDRLCWWCCGAVRCVNRHYSSISHSIHSV